MHFPDHPRVRFIRSQGDFDGACLLYSLANATQALTRRQVLIEDWSAMIQSLTGASNFLDNVAGSKDTDSDQVAQEVLAKNILLLLSPTLLLTAETVIKLKDGSLRRIAPSADTVIVCSNQQHWFCIVDSDDHYAYVACSWVWQRDPGSYVERVSPRLGRIYNDVVKCKDLEFFENRALVVSHK